MVDTIRDNESSIYEIGYLIAGVPEERVSVEAEGVRGAVKAAGASIIAEEAPKHERLAYTMRKKTVSGAYDKHDAAFFGWIKFEVGSDKIEALKKAIEAQPNVLRMLLLSTVRENTYLGKRAPAIAASFSAPARRSVIMPTQAEMAIPAVAKESQPAAPASIEEMDKSIDEMVKEA